ncbi:MAG: cation:proton antiporter [Candidatus Bathyarchaeota archaeon]
MHSENLIILVCVTLLISYLSSLIYSKTRVPDILLLMGFGLLVGPVFQLFDKELFLELAPMMSILALSIILFEAGINVDITMLLDYLGKSLLLSSFSLISVIIVMGLILNSLLPQDFTLLQAMLLGAMVGGTSTVSTFGILSGLQKSVKDIGTTRVLLTMESIVSDPLCIIASITIIKMIMLPNVSLMDGVRDIFGTFTLSSAFGLAVGLVWARVLNRLRNQPFTYMITLAVLLPTYIMSEHWVGEGGGAMTALAFGLAITNYRFIMERLGSDSKVMVDKQRLREFHEEITFFIKSFFFVYIGLVVSLSLKYSFIGFGLTLMLMIIRYGVVHLLSKPMAFTNTEKVLSQFVYTSGLPAFVMSQLPMIYDPAGRYFVNSSIYPDLCMPIVLGTVIYGALVAPAAMKQSVDEIRKKAKELLAEEEVASPANTQ